MRKNKEQENLAHDLEYDVLAYLVKTKQILSLYLKNGIRLQGMIQAFDSDTIYLFNPQTSNTPSTQQLVYKQTISSISFEMAELTQELKKAKAKVE